MRTRKSWREKLADDKGLPRVETITPKMSARWGVGTVVIPAPREVDVLMRQVPRGKVTTINEIRAAVAKKHRASIGCPITVGIFAWIAANAAEEAAANGKKRVTPYWRTLKTDGQVNGKYPGGAEAVSHRLAAESHKILKRGKNLFVSDFEKSLITPKFRNDKHAL